MILMKLAFLKFLIVRAKLGEMPNRKQNIDQNVLVLDTFRSC